MKRVSVAALMGLIVLCAVGFTALRNPNEFWAGTLLALNLGLVGLSALGIVYRRGARRAAWVGYLLFGGGYLAIAFGPWLTTSIRPLLPTTRILTLLRLRVDVPTSLQNADMLIIYSRLASLTDALNQVKSREGPNDPEVRRLQRQVDQLKALLSPVESKGPLHVVLSVLAGATGGERFDQTGHGLFALSCGLLGAIIGRHFHRTMEPAGPTTG